MWLRSRRTVTPRRSCAPLGQVPARETGLDRRVKVDPTLVRKCHPSQAATHLLSEASWKTLPVFTGSPSEATRVTAAIPSSISTRTAFPARLCSTIAAAVSPKSTDSPRGATRVRQQPCAADHDGGPERGKENRSEDHAPV